VAIDCDHPRPRIQLPGYVPRRMAWQVPQYIPGLPPDAARVIREALTGVYQELSRQGQVRNVIPLEGDMYAAPGSVITGVANGQTVTLLPPGALGYSDPVSLVITDVVDPITVVAPDGTATTIGSAGAYDFAAASADEYETSPGGSVLAGGITTDRLLGRDTAGTGAVELISLTAPLEFTGARAVRIAAAGITESHLNASVAGDGLTGGAGTPLAVGAGTGVTVTANAVSVTTPLTDGDKGDITVSSSGTNWQIDADVVTNTELANMAAGRVKGVQVDGALGDPQDLTGLEVGELLRRETVVVDTTSSGSSATYTVANITTQVQFKLTGALTIHGMTATTATFGKTLELSFDDGFAGSVTLTNESASAGAALERIRTPGGVDFVLLAGESCILTYFDSRWRVTGVGKPARRRLPGDPIYDVMDAPFNAAGDGVTDDTAAINAAIAAANAVPGPIYLGTSHLVSTGLDPITSNAVEIIGRGMEEDGTEVTCSTSPAAIFTFANGARFSGIRDVRIVGDSGTTGYGILFQQAFRCFAENVRITEVGNGVEIDRCNTTYIENVDVIEPLGDYGFHVHGLDPDFCHVTRFVRCQVGGSGSGYTGFAHGSFAHTALYHECGVLYGSVGMHLFDDQGSAPTFVHAWQFSTDHPSDCGILIDACEGAVWFDQVLVTSVLTGGTGIETGSAASNYQFHGGQIYGTGQHGFVLGGSGAKIQGLDITAVGVDAANTYDAIAVTAGVTDFVIQGCSIGDVPGTSSGERYGISIGAGCDDYIITGNIITGSATAAILNTPGRASTRVVRSNIPDTGGWIPDADYGDITVSSDGTVWNIDADVVTNTELANMAEGTVKGRALAAGTGDPQDLTGIQTGALIRYDVIIDTSSTGTIASYAPTGFNSATTTIRLNPAGTMVIRGMALAAGQQIAIRLGRTASNTLTINHEDTSASADTERFNCPGSANITLRAGEAVIIRNTESRNNIIAAGRVSVSDGDYGDITVSSNGTVWTIDNNAVTTAKIADGNVTLAKVANQADDTFLANISGVSGPPSAVALTTLAGAGLTGGADAVLAVGAGTGITVNANDVAVTIPLTDGDKGDITVTTSGTVWTIDNSAVTLAKMANLAAGTTIGRQVDGGTGVPVALTGVEQGENLRRETVVVDSTSSGTSATYAIANITTQVQFKLTGALTINGMTASSATFGKLVVFSFDSGFAGSVTWNNESGSAGASLERVRTPGGAALTISAGETATFEYFDSRWRCVAVGKANALTDGDKGDITVSASGATWTIDNNAVTTAKIIDAAVTLAKMADLAQSRIVGRAEGAGTGVPTALTPAQVVSVIDGEAVTWTASHEFTGAAFTVNTSSADALIGATGGVGIFSGQATANVTNGDLVLNSASGIALNTNGTAVTSATTGEVAITSSTLDIDTSGNITVDTPGNITIATSGTGNTTVTGGSNGLVLTASSTIGLNSPTDLNNTVAIGTAQTSSSTTLNDFALTSVAALRLSGSGWNLTGIAPSSTAGQLLVIANVHATVNGNIFPESISSSAANRFAGPGTSRQVRPGEFALAWYDTTSSRWRLLSRLDAES
jgi:hypothetical protein